MLYLINTTVYNDATKIIENKFNRIHHLNYFNL